MVKFITCFKKEKLIYKLITLGIIAVTLYFFYLLGCNFCQAMSYPKEKFDMVDVRYTQSILDGNNPFVKREQTAYGVEPPVVYEYAFFNNYVCALVSLIIGGNTLLAHYIVCVLSMLGTGFLGAEMVLEHSETTVAPAFTFLMLQFCHWRYGYIGAAPDNLALFITVLVLYIASRKSFKGRELLCAVGIILVFYTKQYLIGICVTLFFYFWIQSKKSAIKLLVYCLVLTPLSMLVVFRFLPYYWSYSVFSLTAMGIGNKERNGLLYVLEQFGFLSVIFCGLYLVLIVWAAKSLIHRLKNKPEDEKKPGISTVVLISINIAVQIPALIFFARKDGAYLTYFLQMLYPSVIIAASIGLEKLEWTKKKWINIGMYAAIVIFSLYFGWHKLPSHLLSDEEINDWQEAYALMDNVRNEGEIIHYYSTALEGFKKGDSLFQTGHDSALRAEKVDKWKSKSLYQTFCPGFDFITQEEVEYREYIKDRIKGQEVPLVVIPEDADWYITEELLTESDYALTMTKNLAVGNMIYPTEFWVRKER